MSWRTILVVFVILQCMALMGYAAVTYDKLIALAIIASDTAVSFWLIGVICPDIKPKSKGAC